MITDKPNGPGDEINRVQRTVREDDIEIIEIYSKREQTVERWIDGKLFDKRPHQWLFVTYRQG